MALRQARKKLCRNGLAGLCHAVYATVFFRQSIGVEFAHVATRLAQLPVSVDSYLVHLQLRSRFSLGHTLGFAREHLGE